MTNTENRPPSEIALTQTVQKGGCAAKVAAEELRKILARVRFPAAHPELLVDGRFFDDAAIYQVTEEVAMVQTLDFFTPIVDTPKLFGRIAAANALSDVYAMGGRPKTAMGILAFPVATFSEQTVVDVMQGASDILSEANATLVGGHSIDDETLKFGLSVTGFVHPQRLWTNAKARVGDVLILTKALGTGTMTAALKRREASESDIAEAIQSMGTLNHILDLVDDETLQGVHAATDITGFGFSGHSMQLAKASDVSLRVNFESLPFFDRAAEFLEKGFLTKAHRSNASYTESHLDMPKLSALQKLILHDPQTSGGLLLSVQKEKATSLLQQIQKQFVKARIIGEVIAQNPSRVSFE